MPSVWCAHFPLHQRSMSIMMVGIYFSVRFCEPVIENDCARAKADKREGAGIFQPTGAVPRHMITAAFNADPQKIGGATRPGGALAHELPHYQFLALHALMEPRKLGP